jgi:hypothetical protein
MALCVRARLSAGVAARHSVPGSTCQPVQPPGTVVVAHRSAPSPSPIRSAARHGCATPPAPTPTGLGPLSAERHPSPPPSVPLSRPSPAVWRHPGGRPPPPRAGFQTTAVTTAPPPLFFSPFLSSSLVARSHPTPHPLHLLSDFGDQSTTSDGKFGVVGAALPTPR